MTHLLLPNVTPIAAESLERAWAQLDTKTKPPRSLGQLEELAARYSAVRRNLKPPTPKAAIVVMAADHGIAEEGVSAYPQQVTAQMIANFTAGGAAINALCRSCGAELIVADLGSLSSPPKGVRDHRVRAGSRNALREEALTLDEVTSAIRVGLGIAAELAERSINVVGLGEMGIGNTTVASMLSATFCKRSVSELVGRGTGVDDLGLQRKRNVAREALAKHRPDPNDPLDVLCKIGGLEIAGLVGLAIGAASKGMAVVLDGFITTAAALVARALRPSLTDYLFASHRSVEPGHVVLLQELGLKPLLQLDLRLGEGSGAALSLPLFDAATRVLTEMATFESAGVSEKNEQP